MYPEYDETIKQLHMNYMYNFKVVVVAVVVVIDVLNCNISYAHECSVLNFKVLG